MNNVGLYKDIITPHRTEYCGLSSVGLSVALSMCHTSEPCKKRLKRSSYHMRSALGWAQ